MARKRSSFKTATALRNRSPDRKRSPKLSPIIPPPNPLDQDPRGKDAAPNEWALPSLFLHAPTHKGQRAPTTPLRPRRRNFSFENRHFEKACPSRGQHPRRESARVENAGEAPSRPFVPFSDERWEGNAPDLAWHLQLATCLTPFSCGHRSVFLGLSLRWPSSSSERLLLRRAVPTSSSTSLSSPTGLSPGMTFLCATASSTWGPGGTHAWNLNQDEFNFATRSSRPPPLAAPPPPPPRGHIYERAYRPRVTTLDGWVGAGGLF